MKIQESAEDYLETILILKLRIGNVRSIDIVNELNYSKPSISVAIKNLKENGYVYLNEHGYIDLTDAGREIAEKTYDKHKLISSLLISLGVSKEQAIKDACKIEHDISDETFKAISDYYKKSNL